MKDETLRLRLLKMDTSKLKKYLQEEIFNPYIRARDLNRDYFRCIACSKQKSVVQMNAGHYFSAGKYDSLRFDERNVHGECIACNNYSEDHLIQYAVNLIEKIGIDEYNDLCRLAGESRKTFHKWDKFELIEKCIHYKKKLNEIRNQ